jgi:hypothetical protein
MRTAVTRSPIPATTSSLAPKRESLWNSERPRTFNGRTSPGVCGLFFDGGGSDIRISGKVRFTRSRNLSPKNEETRALSKFAIHYPVVPIPFPPHAPSSCSFPIHPSAKRRDSKAAHAALGHPGTVKKTSLLLKRRTPGPALGKAPSFPKSKGSGVCRSPFFAGHQARGIAKVPESADGVYQALDGSAEGKKRRPDRSRGAFTECRSEPPFYREASGNTVPGSISSSSWIAHGSVPLPV